MTSKVEAGKSSAADIVLLLLALAVLVGGIVGFYYFQNQAITPVRAVGLLATVGIAAFISSRTVQGGKLFRFFKDADIERRKVVWPTRQETVQTTIMVLIVTVIISIMLFLIDTVVGWSIRQLIG